ncbi:hypothetical protein J43TS9_58620 [Paenibacillus cineris]|nr:hypothetical protein J43TS9_58620 [Paenibacillus cineris]
MHVKPGVQRYRVFLMIIEIINFSEAEPFYNRKKNFSYTRSVFFEGTSIDVFLMGSGGRISSGPTFYLEFAIDL